MKDLIFDDSCGGRLRHGEDGFYLIIITTLVVAIKNADELGF